MTAFVALFLQFSMEEFIHQFGIDGKLLASQIVNFIILILVLRFAAYRPIVAMLKKRHDKIEEGLAKTAEANKRLAEANEMTKAKMKETEQAALALLKKAEEKGKNKEAAMLEQAKLKEGELLKNAEKLAAQIKDEGQEAALRESVGLIREALAQTVALAPEKIDEALIREAVAKIKK